MAVVERCLVGSREGLEAVVVEVLPVVVVVVAVISVIVVKAGSVNGVSSNGVGAVPSSIIVLLDFNGWFR